MINKGLMVLGGALLLVGCGSSNTTATTTVETGTGYYEDSAVSGVKYVCGSKSGVTGQDGAFTFEKGKGCTFSINSIELRAVLASGLTEGVKVKETNLEVARFLQSLDTDGNPENGISVHADVIAALAANNITTLPSTDAQVQSMVNTLQSVSGYAGVAKSMEDASEHLAGFSAEVTADKSTFSEGATVTFDVAITGSENGLTYTWKEGSTILGQSKQLVKNNFSVGPHIVTLDVTNASDVTLTYSTTVSVVNYVPINVTVTTTSGGFFEKGVDVPLSVNTIDTDEDGLTYTWIDTFRDDQNSTTFGLTIHDSGNIRTIVDTNTTIGNTRDISVSNLEAGKHDITLKVEDSSGNVGYSNTMGIWINFEYAVKTDNNDTVIIDHDQNLTWVNEPLNTKNACKAVRNDTDLANAPGHCQGLSTSEFAGYTNWRVPTINEMSDYMKRTLYGRILTAYDRSCTLMLGTDDNADGYSTVHTRYVGNPDDAENAENKKFGTIQPLAYPTGLRCVRDGV